MDKPTSSQPDTATTEAKPAVSTNTYIDERLRIKTPLNWSGKNLELIREMCRQGEARLAAQLQIAIAADQRASVLAGIYAAAAIGIAGASATSSAIESSLPLLIASATSASAFLAGATLCLFTILPADFWAPGNDPQEWYRDVETNTPVEEAIGQQAHFFNVSIKKNNDALNTNAKWFFRGAMTGICAPVLAALVLAGFTYLPALVSVLAV